MSDHIQSPLNGGLTLDELLQIDKDSITTLVDQDVHFEGKLKVKSGRSILISGTVSGSIESNGTVIVNSSGQVFGSIKAQNAQVAGAVKRLSKSDVIDVAGVLVLAKGAKVQCDALYGDLKAEHGVVISGNIQPRDMAEEVEESQPDSGRPAHCALATGTHGGSEVIHLHPADSQQ